MTHQESILGYLEQRDIQLCDDCLGQELAIQPRQTVNQVCRSLANQGVICRRKYRCNQCGKAKLVNRMATEGQGIEADTGARPGPGASEEIEPPAPSWKPRDDRRGDRAMEWLKFDLAYAWTPFTFQGKHLTFEEHRNARLNKADCSHWGAAVYKWEGGLTQGDHAGEVGVLIGETQDLRQRIKQYVSGTQESGNKYWREQFLTKGDVRLYVLRFAQGIVRIPAVESAVLGKGDIVTKNIRLVLEQLLVMREVARGDEKRWIVNRQL